MLVSFVNAGLISFTESLGVIFGANIGTTITAWLISLLGFGNTFDIYLFLLPLIALSLPFFFSARNQDKSRAEFVIGFVLLFIGIYFFKLNIPNINENTPLIHGLQAFREYRFINVFLFLGIGLLITIIFQSSSATITLTMVLATEGWFSLDYALAMVLGENVGTTFTANIAAIVANRSAKRTALAHFLFNAIGIIWVLMFFKFFSGLVHSAIGLIHSSSSHPEINIIPIGISIFHSGFNIVNTLIFTIFIKRFDNLCYKILGRGSEVKEGHRLKFIESNVLSTSEISILQARKEVALLGRYAASLFYMIPDLLVEKDEKKFAKKIKKLLNLGGTIENMEIEISNYIGKVSRDDLSEQGNKSIRAMLKITDNIQTIADMCLQMSLIIRKKNENKAWFTQELRNNLDKEFKLIGQSLNLMNQNLQKDYRYVDIAEAHNIEEKINTIRKGLKQNYLEEIQTDKFPYQAGIFYNELSSINEKIGNCVFNINMAMHATHKQEQKNK